MKRHYEVAVVGGGISGCALFYQLARYTDVKTLALFEKYEDLATLNSPPKFTLFRAILRFKLRQKLLVAFRAVFVLAADVAVLGADAKDRRYRDVWQLVVIYHAAHEVFACLS